MPPATNMCKELGTSSSVLQAEAIVLLDELVNLVLILTAHRVRTEMGYGSDDEGSILVRDYMCTVSTPGLRPTQSPYPVAHCHEFRVAIQLYLVQGQ